MNSKVVCFLLILSVVFAVAAAGYEEDAMEEMLFEQLMEKRGRKGRGGRGGRKMTYTQCPDNPRCACVHNLETGEYTPSGICGQSNAANVGI